MTIYFAPIQWKHPLVSPTLGEVESCFSPWWPWSKFFNSLAQKAAILLPIDVLWGGDGDLSLMLAFDNQKMVKGNVGEAMLALSFGGWW